MKKLFLTVLTLSLVHIAFSQQIVTDSIGAVPKETKKKKDWSKINFANRANDHFMVQFGYDNWAQTPDSIKITGLGHHFNVYFMLDLPFKSSPHFSIGIGGGIGTSTVYFDKQEPQIAALTARLPFPDVSDTTHFKKFKLATTYLEAPLELRYVSNPANTNKSWKFALGLKIGTMLSAHTKGKKLQNSAGNEINNYIAKENSKRFFNSTRFAGTVRFGYGAFTLYGSYQISSFIKDGVGPNVKPYSIGLTISGL